MLTYCLSFLTQAGYKFTSVMSKDFQQLFIQNFIHKNSEWDWAAGIAYFKLSP